MTKNVANVFAPINLGICPEGKINRKFSNFYIERSGKKIDLTYIGNVAIGKQYRTNNYTPLFLMENKSEWIYMVNKIKENGSLAGVQLGCRFYKYKAVKNMMNDNSEQKIKEISNFISSLNIYEISEIISQFIRQAKVAIDLGFDYIQIHAAHGYFLSLLLSKSLNLRNDKYNCSDCLFIYEIVEGIRKYSSKIKIDLRISLIEGIKKENIEFNQRLATLKKLSEFGFNMISLSNGIYDINKFLIYPTLDKGFYPMSKYEKIILSINKNINWNFSGNINSIKKIRNLPINKQRSFSIGRPLIADPLFLLKNEEIKSNNCIDCGKCNYYTNGFHGLICPQYENKYKRSLLRDIL
ncbi:hypothetical protein [Peptoniphilus harei]|uniref:oxidoreductase n=1 Tax=Peptoniphilus harei TaxID=54005 RepID=UPI0011DCEE71|nr:hypothetical protein [Peptoniphilus harei]